MTANPSEPHSHLGTKIEPVAHRHPGDQAVADRADRAAGQRQQQHDRREGQKLLREGQQRQRQHQPCQRQRQDAHPNAARSPMAASAGATGSVISGSSALSRPIWLPLQAQPGELHVDKRHIHADTTPVGQVEDRAAGSRGKVAVEMHGVTCCSAGRARVGPRRHTRIP